LPSGRRHYVVTLADAIAAHERALRTGGLGGIGNLSYVLSAIERPYIGYYRPIASKAAALLQSVATNHGFNDGNKRTSLILLNLLLDKSGYRLEPVDRQENLNLEIEKFIADCVVKDHWSVERIAEWLKMRIRRV
jgi:death-on-curing protein